MGHWPSHVAGHGLAVGPCLLVSHLEACVTRQDQLEVLSDTFKGKAPSTILKRARSLPALHAFLKGRGATFPCTEEDVYAFLKQLQRDEAPVSRISAVLEALNFTWHVVGVCELESSCKSRRCKGLGVTECFAEAKQAAALTVKQLLTLHEALEGRARGPLDSLVCRSSPHMCIRSLQVERCAALRNNNLGS